MLLNFGGRLKSPHPSAKIFVSSGETEALQDVWSHMSYSPSRFSSHSSYFTFIDPPRCSFKTLSPLIFALQSSVLSLYYFHTNWKCPSEQVDAAPLHPLFPAPVIKATSCHRAPVTADHLTELIPELLPVSISAPCSINRPQIAVYLAVLFSCRLPGVLVCSPFSLSNKISVLKPCYIRWIFAVTAHKGHTKRNYAVE